MRGGGALALAWVIADDDIAGLRLREGWPFAAVA